MYFKEFPFRVTPEKDTTVWADRGELRKEFERFIEDFYKNRTSRIKGMWGYYGAGKSHTLMYISSILKEKNGEFLYYPFPKQAKNFSDVYRQSFIPKFNFLKFGITCKEIYESIKRSKDRFVELEKISNSLMDGWFDFSKLVYDTGKLFSVDDFEAVNEPYFLLVRGWLMGQKLSKSDLKKLGISRCLETDSDCVRALSCLVRICESDFGGKRPLIWALDDCQFMEVLDSKTKNLIQQGLRDAFDASHNGLCLILSVTSRNEELFENLLIEDIKSRMIPSKLQLTTLTENDAMTFVRDLINHSRFRLDGVKDEWHPFDKQSVKEAIKSISEIEDLIPRNIMTHFAAIAESAEPQPNIKKIDLDFIKKYFKKINETA